MTRGEIYELMNRNPAFALATVDNGAPRVRGMLLYEAGAGGIIFHSGKMKDVHRQIAADPRVEMYFLDPGSFVEVRVNGTLEIVEDRELKKAIAEHPTREFIKKWMESAPENFFDQFAVYRLTGGRATVWTMETNFDPKVWIEI